MTATVSGVAEKAMRLHQAGAVEEVPMARVFMVTGDHGTYQVIVSADGARAWCTCPAQAACSHGRGGAAVVGCGRVTVFIPSRTEHREIDR